MRLAAAVARRYPAVSVQVVDLDREPAARPANLIAVPTYILDGRTVALGNPRQKDFFRQLERLLEIEAPKEVRDGAP
jgi:hypothetical protein